MQYTVRVRTVVSVLRGLETGAVGIWSPHTVLAIVDQLPPSSRLLRSTLARKSLLVCASPARHLAPN